MTCHLEHAILLKVVKLCEAYLPILLFWRVFPICNHCVGLNCYHTIYCSLGSTILFSAPLAPFFVPLIITVQYCVLLQYL